MENPNRTRDHLANERTYLSWIRTALALIGFAVVLVRLRPLPAQQNDLDTLLSLVPGLVGVLMVPFATWHYFEVRHSIEGSSYQPHGRWIWMCSATLFFLGSGLLVYLAL